MHLTVDIKTEFGGPSDDEYGLLWWIIEEAQEGWILCTWARRATHPRAPEIASSDRLPVRCATGQPDRQVYDLEPLNNVFISAFP